MKAEKRRGGPELSQKGSQNPFEAKWSVLAGTSRKRKSLNAETRSKRNVFADRRIGEDDPQLPEEERYLARLQRERTKRSRKRARFSLADDDERQEAGDDDSKPKVSLLRDDYDETEGVADDVDHEHGADVNEHDSDDGFIKVKEMGSEIDTDQNRTHQEIMEEVVLKSKMHKARRQQEKFELDEQTAKLDQDMQNIMALLNKSSRDFDKKQAEEKRNRADESRNQASIFDAGDGQENAKQGGQGKHLALTSVPAEKKEFHYEQIYLELASEKKARPSNRLLTEEEKAEKEMTELQELEAKRIERMRSAADSEDEEDSDVESSRKGKVRRRKEEDGSRARIHAGGDDLDDGFDLSRDDVASEVGEGFGEDEPHGTSDGDMQRSTEERRAADELEGQGFQKQKCKRASSKESEQDGIAMNPDTLVFRSSNSTNITDDEIPYIFKECPSTTTQLQKLFEGKTVEQRDLIVTRLLKCFAPSLNPAQNSAKLDRLVNAMLERIEDLSAVSADKINAAVQETDMLLDHIHVLGSKREESISSWARERVAASFSALTSSGKAKWLSCRWTTCTILLLRAVGRLFPASDLRHPVTTPLVMLLSEALELKRIQSTEDFSIAVLVGYVLLEQLVEGGRYSGQLTTFLAETIRASASWMDVDFSQAMREQREAGEDHDKNDIISPLKISDCMRPTITKSEKLALQTKIIHAVAKMIDTSCHSGEIPHMDIIYRGLPVEAIPESQTRESVEEQLIQAKNSRQPLAMYARKSNVVVTKTLNPKFSAENGVFRKKPRTSYVAQRSGNASASATRVKRALKKEERGLARDVRRAAGQAAQQRAQAEIERADRREKRTREMMTFLESQQATWKKAEKRQKKLSGKKW